MKIRAYFRVYVNKELNNKAKLMLIAKFLYNFAKNINIENTIFKLNYRYYLYMFF